MIYFTRLRVLEVWLTSFNKGGKDFFLKNDHEQEKASFCSFKELFCNIIKVLPLRKGILFYNENVYTIMEFSLFGREG